MRLLLLLSAAVLAVSCSPSSDPEAKRPPASAANSRVALAAGSVAADGTTPATVTVTVRDDAGAPISGAPVALAYAGAGTVTAIRPTTDGSGSALFTVTAPAPTVGAVTARVEEATLAAAPTLTFHGCEYGGFVNGACAPPPFVLLPPAVPASWGGVRPTSFSVGDLDGNGLDDVVVADSEGHSVQVLVAYGDGRFAPRASYDTGGAIYGAVAADVTGDAIVDVVTIANAGASGNRLIVVPGAGDGTLLPAVSVPLSGFINLERAADMDGDGDVDLVGRATGGVGILRNLGTGAFGPLQLFATTDLYWTPTTLAVADVDGNGTPDVVTAFANASEAEVRLGNGDGTLGAPARYATGPNPGSIATGDVDGDGDLDVVTSNFGDSVTWYVAGTVSVLLGRGDGTFGAQAEFEAGRSPQSVAVADLDGDGLADVVTADANSASVSVLRAAGGGALAPPVRYLSAGIPRQVATARLDAGALPDLVVLDSASGTISTALGLGSGTFAAPRMGPFVRLPDRVGAGDVTGDGRADLVSIGDLAGEVIIAAGNGDGTFGRSVPVALPGPRSMGSELVVAQLDGAGGEDAVVLNKETLELAVLLSSGGTLVRGATYTASPGAGYLAIGDLDEDGLPDVVVVNSVGLPGTLSVFPGAGGGALGAEVVHAVGGNASAVAIGDVDGDQHLDLVVIGFHYSQLRVFPGDGTGALGAPISFAFPLPPSPIYGRPSVALADLDADGDLDAVITDGSGVVAFANDGSGSLAIQDSQPVGAAPYSIALGDVDGDGHVDAVTADQASQSITLLRGLGDATFAPGRTYSGYRYPNEAIIADLNGDAYGDIAVADWGTSTLPVTLGSPTSLDGWSPVPMGERPSDLALHDLDGDGSLDLVAIANERAGLTVAMGRGGGAFERGVTRQIGGYPAAVSLRDVNGDAKVDAVVTHIPFKTPEGVVIVPGGVGVLLGNGDGTFGAETLYPAGDNARSVALGDVNGDGRIDVVVPSFPGALLLTQNVDGTFAAPVLLPTAPPPEALVSPDPLTPSAVPDCVDVALADLNGDGKLDLAAANAAPLATAFPINEVAILLGNGDGTFQPRMGYATVSPVNLLVVDLDADGDLDVAAATNNPRASLLLGDGLGGFAANDFGIPAGGIDIASGDLDLDGLPDLVTSNGFAALAAHRNVGPGDYESFTFATRDPIRGLEVGDLDGDGRPDVAALTASGVFPLLTRLP